MRLRVTLKSSDLRDPTSHVLKAFGQGVPSSARHGMREFNCLTSNSPIKHPPSAGRVYQDAAKTEWHTLYWHIRLYCGPVFHYFLRRSLLRCWLPLLSKLNSSLHNTVVRTAYRMPVRNAAAARHEANFMLREAAVLWRQSRQSPFR